MVRIKSLIKIGQHFYGEWINGMKEAASMSEQNASSIREAERDKWSGKRFIASNLI